MRIEVENGAEPYELTRRAISQAKAPFSSEDLSRQSPWVHPQICLKLKTHRGRFVKKCPGTPRYLCCGYHIFHFAENCPLGCSYCILQTYFESPCYRLFGNLIEDGLEELRQFLTLKTASSELVRIGTGEFTDSLVFEPVAGVVEHLVGLWKEIDPLAVLEFKTKTAPSKKFFERFPADRRVIFAWSVNTERVIEREERATASLKARLRSAEYALEQGFSLAFHFDPIILYEGAEEEYAAVLQLILNTFPLDRLVWISLGTLRFHQELKEVAMRHFPQTKIFSDEFIRGLDQKYRYFVERRLKAYRQILGPVKRSLDELPLYFCMESSRVWQEVLAKPFRTSAEVSQLLDRYARKVCFS